MLGRRSATTADDARPGRDGQPHVLRHQLRGAGVVDLRTTELGNAAVALGDERGVRVGLGHREQRHQDVGGADATVRTGRNRRGIEAGEDAGELARHEPHHRAARSVERAGRHVGHPYSDRRRRRGAHFLDRRHRLDPRNVGAAGHQPFDLLGEGLDGVGLGQLAEGYEQRSGGSDGPGDDHRPVRGVGDFTREL